MNPINPEPEQYPKTVYVDAPKPAAPVKEPKVAIVVNSPEEEARALKGEPVEAMPSPDRVPEPTVQERQAYEKVVAYERQNLSPSQKARLEQAEASAPRAAKKPARKASKPSAKRATKKASQKAAKKKAATR